MRIAVMSDIHANLEALHSVLEDMADERVDRRVCLGDCVGYGGAPQEVLERIWAEGIPVIMGNHEEAAFNLEILDWFNPQARQAAMRTRELLFPESIEKIEQWPTSLDFEGALCVHGFPPDSVHMYLFEASVSRLVQEFETMSQDICFVGHTHSLTMISYDGDDLASMILGEGVYPLEGVKHLVNVGSVGQPRDGDNRAKYVIWDQENRSIEVRCVCYDISKTTERIIAAGMPPACALRLW